MPLQRPNASRPPMDFFSGSAAFLVILFVISFGTVRGQSAQISGQVVDESKAAISGARLSITQVETGDHREVTSTIEGYYSFPLLPPGHYVLTVTKDRFETVHQSGIVVQTGTITTANVTLAVGQVTQTIAVDAAVPLIQTESVAVQKVIENQTIVDMPLLDRRASQLQRLNGFEVGNGSGSGATFAVAGGRSNNGNYTIDGGNVQNALLGTATLYFDPPVESLQEFNVAISNYAAELGRSGGGVVQMTTKSGTNSFHRSAYEYLRNDVLQGTPFFAVQKSPLRYNLFGISVGGPIIRNKTHFFFNYEGFRQNTATTLVLNVPTKAEASGDFSQESYAVIDPDTGKQYPGNIVTNLDPVGAKIAALFPAPNVPGAPSGKANFTANDPAQSITNTYVARVDQMTGSRRMASRTTNSTSTQSARPRARLSCQAGIRMRWDSATLKSKPPAIPATTRYGRRTRLPLPKC